MLLLCDTTFLGRRNTHTHICSPQIGISQIKNKVWIPPKVQLGEPVNFIGATYRSMGEESQEQRWLRDSCIQGPPQHGWQPRKSGKLGAYCTASGSSASWRVLSEWLCSSSGQLGWCLLLPGSSSALRSLCSFVVIASTLLLGERLSSFIAYPGRVGPSESGWFGGLCYLSCLPCC